MKFPDDFIDQVILGDSLEVLKEIPDNSIDTIICDPPYGLEFMGKEWDTFKEYIRPDLRDRYETQIRNVSGFSETGYKDIPKHLRPSFSGKVSSYWADKGIREIYDLWEIGGRNAFQVFTYNWAKEVLRVAKPGAMLLAFGGTRTWHRLACGLEDAGWEIRDTLMWVYGSGFPKSLNIGKAVDKLQGNERYELGERGGAIQKGSPNWQGIDRTGGKGSGYKEKFIETKGTSEWEGYGTALKPSYEPIILAMKPLDGTFAENALKWGVAGLNIDEARIEINKTKETDKRCITGINNVSRGKHNGGIAIAPDGNNYPMYKEGRFPANLLLDEVSAEMLDQSDNASRFFYVAKASRSERDAGLDGFEPKITQGMRANAGPALVGDDRVRTTLRNFHPTVKPIKLMDYLVKLTKMPSPDQVYLDPFLGSGTTAIAVVLNGRHFIGIEKEPEYVEIAKARIKYWSSKANQTFEFEEVENEG
jgi:site-specific DNA-methyltransferase (adenine-specific)